MRAPRRFRTTVLCLGLALGATACLGKGGPSAAPAPSASSSTPSPSASSTPSPTPTPSPTETGLAALSAEEINQKANEALLKAGSLRIKGLLRDDGETLVVDLALDSKNACSGSIAAASMGRMELVSTGSQRWLKANRVFWESVIEGEDGKAAADELEGRYLTGFGDDPDMADAFSVCDLKQLTEETIGGGEEAGTSPFLHKGTAGSIRGVKTFSVTETIGPLRTEMHVADEGIPYPLRVEVTVGTDAPIRLDFTDYNVPLVVKAPPARQVLDLGELEKDAAGA